MLKVNIEMKKWKETLYEINSNKADFTGWRAVTRDFIEKESSNSSVHIDYTLRQVGLGITMPLVFRNNGHTVWIRLKNNKTTNHEKD